MAVGYHSGDLPSDYGLVDWHHGLDGKVDYSWNADTPKCYDPEHPTDWKKLAEENDITYKEVLSDIASYENMMMINHRRSTIIEGFREYERIMEEYN